MTEHPTHRPAHGIDGHGLHVGGSGPVHRSGSRGWQGHLSLHYRHEDGRTKVLDRHSGPLRILQSLHPEGQGICHNVLVHPPAGIAGGDRLSIDARLDPGSHALVTTPGATRFYRSLGDSALQSLEVHAGAGTRLEWLPLETLCYRRALAENRMRFELAPGAEMIGWDVLALGLPASGEPFDAGRFTQQIELPGVWLERGTLDGGDTRLLQSPLGLAGHTVMATMWFAAGSPLAPDRREALLEDAREQASTHVLGATTGSSSAHAQVVVLRALAHRVEPAMGLLRSVWARWRTRAWGLSAEHAPRVWQT
jgi:urease accessory protein